MNIKCLKYILFANLFIFQGIMYSSEQPSIKQIDSMIDDIDLQVNKITIEHTTSNPQKIRELIKSHAQKVLNHCVTLAMNDFDKNDQMIDQRWLNFFGDCIYFNNKKYQHCFQEYYQQHPAIGKCIHFTIERQNEHEKIMLAYEGIFPIGNGAIGKIEYTSYDEFEQRPEIKILIVEEQFRCRAIGYQLVKRALADIKNERNELQEVHVFACPIGMRLDAQQRITQMPLLLNRLIAFYVKCGAGLIKKYNSSAQMMFNI